MGGMLSLLARQLYVHYHKLRKGVLAGVLLSSSVSSAIILGTCNAHTMPHTSLHGLLLDGVAAYQVGLPLYASCMLAALAGEAALAAIASGTAAVTCVSEGVARIAIVLAVGHAAGTMRALLKPQITALVSRLGFGGEASQLTNTKQDAVNAAAPDAPAEAPVATTALHAHQQCGGGGSTTSWQCGGLAEHSSQPSTDKDPAGLGQLSIAGSLATQGMVGRYAARSRLDLSANMPCSGRSSPRAKSVEFSASALEALFSAAPSSITLTTASTAVVPHSAARSSCTHPTPQQLADAYASTDRTSFSMHHLLQLYKAGGPVQTSELRELVTVGEQGSVVGTAAITTAHGVGRPESATSAYELARILVGAGGAGPSSNLPPSASDAASQLGLHKQHELAGRAYVPILPPSTRVAIKIDGFEPDTLPVDVGAVYSSLLTASGHRLHAYYVRKGCVQVVLDVEDGGAAQAGTGPAGPAAAPQHAAGGPGGAPQQVAAGAAAHVEAAADAASVTQGSVEMHLLISDHALNSSDHALNSLGHSTLPATLGEGSVAGGSAFFAPSGGMEAAAGQRLSSRGQAAVPRSVVGSASSVVGSGSSAAASPPSRRAMDAEVYMEALGPVILAMAEVRVQTAEGGVMTRAPQPQGVALIDGGIALLDLQHPTAAPAHSPVHTRGTGSGGSTPTQPAAARTQGAPPELLMLTPLAAHVDTSAPGSHELPVYVVIMGMAAGSQLPTACVRAHGMIEGGLGTYLRARVELMSEVSHLPSLLRQLLYIHNSQARVALGASSHVLPSPSISPVPSDPHTPSHTYLQSMRSSPDLAVHLQPQLALDVLRVVVTVPHGMTDTLLCVELEGPDGVLSAERSLLLCSSPVVSAELCEMEHEIATALLHGQASQIQQMQAARLAAAALGQPDPAPADALRALRITSSELEAAHQSARGLLWDLVRWLRFVHQQQAQVLLPQAPPMPAHVVQSAAAVASSPGSSSYTSSLGGPQEAVPGQALQGRSATQAQRARPISVASTNAAPAPPSPRTAENARRAVRLVGYAAGRGWAGVCGLAIRGSLAPAAGGGPSIIPDLATLDMRVAADNGGLSIAHLSIMSGKPAMLQALASWAAAHSYTWGWSTAGPQGLTPLHLLAAREEVFVLLPVLLRLFPQVGRLWSSVRCEGGDTPEEFLRRVTPSAPGGHQQGMGQAAGGGAGTPVGLRGTAPSPHREVGQAGGMASLLGVMAGVTSSSPDTTSPDTNSLCPLTQTAGHRELEPHSDVAGGDVMGGSDSAPDLPADPMGSSSRAQTRPRATELAALFAAAADEGAAAVVPLHGMSHPRLSALASAAAVQAELVSGSSGGTGLGMGPMSGLNSSASEGGPTLNSAGDGAPAASINVTRVDASLTAPVLQHLAAAAAQPNHSAGAAAAGARPMSPRSMVAGHLRSEASAGDECPPTGGSAGPASKYSRGWPSTAESLGNADVLGQGPATADSTAAAAVAAAAAQRRSNTRPSHTSTMHDSSYSVRPITLAGLPWCSESGMPSGDTRMRSGTGTITYLSGISVSGLPPSLAQGAMAEEGEEERVEGAEGEAEEFLAQLQAQG